MLSTTPMAHLGVTAISKVYDFYLNYSEADTSGWQEELVILISHILSIDNLYQLQVYS